MSQTNYDLEFALGFEGMLAQAFGLKQVDSRVSEESTPFSYGRAVVAGTDPDSQALLPTAAGKLLGVSSHSHANAVDGDDLNLINEHMVFNVLHVGRVWVVVEDAVTPASGVFCRRAVDGGFSRLGGFAGSAGTGLGAVTGARFVTSAGAGELAILELDATATLA